PTAVTTPAPIETKPTPQNNTQHSLPPIMPAPAVTAGIAPAHASPSIRRFARELGADLQQIRGSGAKGRILRDDVTAWVKYQISNVSNLPAAGNAGMGIPPIPEVDFSEFGEIEMEAFSRIKKVSGPHLHRAWLNIPHVTHHDEADITLTEEFRQSLKEEAAKKGVRITLLSFIMKALVACLKEYPHFNSSLSADGKGYILKKYYNIGIAVDTPNGLMVPVIHHVDRLSVNELSESIMDISQRARDGKIKPNELKGGCISISSLGGIGGTAFTPIVNAPEVAILGVTRAKMKPVWDGKEFQPRFMLPMDLSYDHRAVDGAQAARFMSHLISLVSDVRRLSL
ncbi:MAG: 2-oxo acid dehydrogenase subunit E2, partial [Arenicellales bacterium]